MIYVLNKNKIISCIISGMLVLFLFAIGIKKEPNQDVELIKVISDNITNSTQNYIKIEK